MEAKAMHLGLTRMGALVVVAGLAAGCDQIGSPLDALEGNLPPPDEFEVVTTKPLQMPNSLALPEPRLGERSPLEPDPQAEASAALLGSATARAANTVSRGEAALLGAADARAVDPDIRRTLRVEAETGVADAPYEAPTVGELLGISEAGPEDAIDPAAEARRLQADGVAAAPIDPTDRAPETYVWEPGVESGSYPSVGDKRPNNQLNPESEPAFQ